MKRTLILISLIISISIIHFAQAKTTDFIENHRHRHDTVGCPTGYIGYYIKCTILAPPDETPCSGPGASENHCTKL